MTRSGIEPRSPGPLANTLTPRPMSGAIYIYIYIYALNSPANLEADEASTVRYSTGVKSTGFLSQLEAYSLSYTRKL